MKDVGGMDVLQAAEGLIYERLEVGIGERLARADLKCYEFLATGYGALGPTIA